MAKQLWSKEDYASSSPKPLANLRPGVLLSLVPGGLSFFVSLPSRLPLPYLHLDPNILQSRVEISTAFPSCYDSQPRKAFSDTFNRSFQPLSDAHDIFHHQPPHLSPAVATLNLSHDAEQRWHSQQNASASRVSAYEYRFFKHPSRWTERFGKWTATTRRHGAI